LTSTSIVNGAGSPGEAGVTEGVCESNVRVGEPTDAAAGVGLGATARPEPPIATATAIAERTRRNNTEQR
jgi:hypothetical protein